ncbi:hypothetical protein J4218_00065 [Candidatus Pacearchaeota archaeon]|nr:hypothetical protein [Candidatus Pacearchaeota archaeon]
MESKKGIIGLIVFFIILILVLLVGYIGYLFVVSGSNNEQIRRISAVTKNPLDLIKNRNSLINLNNISGNYTNNSNFGLNSSYNETEVIKQGVREFNESYVDYILYAIGADGLHWAIGFGNPFIETVLGDETYISEIVNDVPVSKKENSSEEDIRIIISKEEAVKSLLAPDLTIFMQNSFKNGNTNIEMVAGNTELFAKGYLGLYKDLTGNESVT